jgi:chemotaxis methyl-accepting protein methylase
MIRRFLHLYLRLNRLIWNHLPISIKKLPIGMAYGRQLHWVVSRLSKRNQSHATFFMRNRPEMELMCRVVDQKSRGADVTISVLGCSKGAEVYSILWNIRRSRPDLRVTLQAVDVSAEIVDFAREGAYSLKGPDSFKALDDSRMTADEKLFRLTYRDQGFNECESIFERLDQSDMDAMFDRSGDRATVKPWLREGIAWRVGDASDRGLIRELGAQDVVVANRFLCHMPPAAAENCLRNLSNLVRRGGYIFVSGVDLDVRTRVAKELHWEPVSDLIREIHEGDFSLTPGWPLNWWGLEPFRQERADWKIRYASVFRVGENRNSSLMALQSA